ncbi:hypothetical protein [Lusitaniella coriacea]|uniref:hypothetical protein n=1 Tax=Lusitaniella coriacea TaxID=1983105 RepID=UPI003CF5C7B7
MNTPSHYILNLAVLGTLSPGFNGAITLGAIAPDFPIFAFYLVVRAIEKRPKEKIWSEAYYEPFWQNCVAIGHSVPLAVLGLLVCLYCGWQPGTLFFGSAILHSCLDFPLHNDDAHRHFFPISDYRFISPVSYWDPRHYGKIAASIEFLLVLATVPIVFNLLESPISKGILGAIALLYLWGYSRLYLRILSPKKTSQTPQNPSS